MSERYAIINACDWGSTGKIAKGFQTYMTTHGEKSLFCYGRGRQIDDGTYYRSAKDYEVIVSALMTRATGMISIGAKPSTKRLIKRLRQEQITKIFALNLHDHYLDEELFLNYIVSDNIGLVYIMIDEHAYLGNCVYKNGCNNFKEGCKNCPKQSIFQKIVYPHASEIAFKRKKKIYEKMKHAIFVGPEFVVKEAKDSPLLENIPTSVVDEAIDTTFFCPQETVALRKLHNISDDKVIIGCVAPISQPAKGVQFFIDAAKRMEKDDRFVFVHVGYKQNDRIALPSNYISVDYVKDQNLLAQYYSLIDLFVFPSIQDTMPNACLEALACGTPLLCFDISGMPYIADDAVMTLIEPRNVERMTEVIRHSGKKDQTTIDICRNYALSRYDNQKYYRKLVDLATQLT